MKKNSRENKIRRAKKKLIAYGYVARWRDETLGWVMPNLSYCNDRKWPSKIYAGSNVYGIGEKSYLCKITIEAIPGARAKVIR